MNRICFQSHSNECSKSVSQNKSQGGKYNNSCYINLCHKCSWYYQASLLVCSVRTAQDHLEMKELASSARVSQPVVQFFQPNVRMFGTVSQFQMQPFKKKSNLFHKQFPNCLSHLQAMASVKFMAQIRFSLIGIACFPFPVDFADKHQALPKMYSSSNSLVTTDFSGRRFIFHFFHFCSLLFPLQVYILLIPNQYEKLS